MTISEIIKVYGKKNIFKVVFDDSAILLLSADTIVKHGLKPGLCLSSSEYKKISAEDKSARVIADALALVEKRSYSSKTLYDKLLQKGYRAKDCSYAIKRLSELNYIDDLKYAKTLVSYNISRGKGEYAIKDALEKAGIKEEIINNVLEVLKTAEEPYERIMEIMRKKFKNFDGKDKNETARTANFFLRRGFSCEDISKAFRKYKNIALCD